MQLFRRLPFIYISLAHFAVDNLSGLTPILLAFLSAPLGLANAGIGLVSTLSAMASALPQPIFGWISDRFGHRWTSAAGLLWIAFFFSLVPWVPGRWVLVVLVAAAVGSAAFHPSGAAKAAEDGSRYLAGSATTAAALFFFFGAGGTVIGPALGGFLIDQLGLPGVLAFSAIGFAVAALAIVRSGWEKTGTSGRAPLPQGQGRLFLKEVRWGGLILLLSIASLRYWAQLAAQTFIPKFYMDLGYSTTSYGLITGMFMAGGLLGGLVGGVLGDRWGNRKTIVTSLALSVAPLYFFPLARGLALLGLIALAGAFNGAPHSILVTMAQKSLPGRIGLASGIALGSMFTAGAVGVYFSGLLADRIGLGVVLQGNALLALGALLVAGLAFRREGSRRARSLTTRGIFLPR
ncbi:MAG: MFS transporter [Anaerolineales bacterium]|jgi:FSR family fosmidomycin resistance protein-like MFS transporter